jgi:HTH-type transcriptional regulator/antitoxin HigA
LQHGSWYKADLDHAGYEAALEEVERLWGAKLGTPDGDRLDELATLIDAYEAEHYPMDPPAAG